MYQLSMNPVKFLFQTKLRQWSSGEACTNSVTFPLLCLHLSTCLNDCWSTKQKAEVEKTCFPSLEVCRDPLSSDWLVLGNVWICYVWAIAGNGPLLVSSSVLSLYSAYTEPYKVCPVSVLPAEVITSDEEQRSSEDEKSSQGDPSLINKVKELH